MPSALARRRCSPRPEAAIGPAVLGGDGAAASRHVDELQAAELDGQVTAVVELHVLVRAAGPAGHDLADQHIGRGRPVGGGPGRAGRSGRGGQQQRLRQGPCGSIVRHRRDIVDLRDRRARRIDQERGRAGRSEAIIAGSAFARTYTTRRGRPRGTSMAHLRYHRARPTTSQGQIERAPDQQQPHPRQGHQPRRGAPPPPRRAAGGQCRRRGCRRGSCRRRRDCRPARARRSPCPTSSRTSRHCRRSSASPWCGCPSGCCVLAFVLVLLIVDEALPDGAVERHRGPLRRASRCPPRPSSSSSSAASWRPAPRTWWAPSWGPSMPCCSRSCT